MLVKPAGVDLLNAPLTLPCGLVVSNRLYKAATSEGIADELNRATPEHCTLYRKWAEGGCGIVITGNVMIYREHLERPGNIVITPETRTDEEQLARLRAMAKAGTDSGSEIFMQVSHPGRQANPLVNTSPVAPSEITLKSVFGVTYVPRELTLNEIEEIIERFMIAAEICKECGFSGVQLHAAHGYLISEFLSPLSNRRTDKYGGVLDNRMRLLLRLVDGIRQVVGPEFPISIKLTGHEFQRGGYTIDECCKIVKVLDERGVDMIEVSGGTYEDMAMLYGAKNATDRANNTFVKEAYFQDYAAAVSESVTKTVVVLTGGIRSRPVMEELIRDNTCHMIGIARPANWDPHCAKKLLSKQIDILPAYQNSYSLPFAIRFLKYFGIGKSLIAKAPVMLNSCNILNISEGKEPLLPVKMNAINALFQFNKFEEQKANELQGLTCVGSVVNQKKQFNLGSLGFTRSASFRKQDSWIQQETTDTSPSASVVTTHEEVNTV